MRKILILTLSLIMICSIFAGCANKDKDTNTSSTENTNNTTSNVNVAVDTPYAIAINEKTIPFPGTVEDWLSAGCFMTSESVNTNEPNLLKITCVRQTIELTIDKSEQIEKSAVKKVVLSEMENCQIKFNGFLLGTTTPQQLKWQFKEIGDGEEKDDAVIYTYEDKTVNVTCEFKFIDNILKEITLITK